MLLTTGVVDTLGDVVAIDEPVGTIETLGDVVATDEPEDASDLEIEPTEATEDPFVECGNFLAADTSYEEIDEASKHAISK